VVEAQVHAARVFLGFSLRFATFSFKSFSLSDIVASREHTGILAILPLFSVFGTIYPSGPMIARKSNSFGML